MPDAVGFYTDLTGRENLRYTARLNRIPSALAEETIDEVLEQVGLTSRADDPVETYSRGMLQRLGIADALVKDPDVLILDEPTTAIDPLGVVEILDLLRTLVRERGMAILLSSHLLNQVQSVCDRIGIFAAGRLIGQGTLADLAERVGESRAHVEVALRRPTSRRAPAIARGARRDRGRRVGEARRADRATPWTLAVAPGRERGATSGGACRSSSPSTASSWSRSAPSSRRSRTSTATRSPGPRPPMERSSDRARCTRRTPPVTQHAPARERSVPRAGWMVISRKEFADHILSSRFFVLLLRPRRRRGRARCTSPPTSIRAAASEASGGQAIFIALFWFTPPDPGPRQRRDAAERRRILRSRRAAARPRVRVRRGERRARPGHAAAAPVAADPPRRRHQRQVRGRAVGHRARDRGDRRADRRARDPPARDRPDRRGAPADHRLGRRSRSSTSRCGWRSGCCCRSSSGGRRRRRSIGFGIWFAITFFGGLITGVIGGFFAPLTGSAEEVLRNNSLQETLSRLLPDILYARGVAGAPQPAGDATSSTPATSAGTSRRPSGSRRCCRSTRASSSSGRRSSRSSRSPSPASRSPTSSSCDRRSVPDLAASARAAIPAAPARPTSSASATPEQDLKSLRRVRPVADDALADRRPLGGRRRGLDGPRHRRRRRRRPPRAARRGACRGGRRRRVARVRRGGTGRGRAARQLHDRVRYEVGDFVALAPDVEPADVVALDRVVCCYPDMAALVSPVGGARAAPVRARLPARLVVDPGRQRRVQRHAACSGAASGSTPTARPTSTAWPAAGLRRDVERTSSGRWRCTSACRRMAVAEPLPLRLTRTTGSVLESRSGRPDAATDIDPHAMPDAGARSRAQRGG